MERDIGEVIASQKAMLERQGRRGAELDEEKLRSTYAAQLNRIQAQLARRPEIRMLKVEYADLVRNSDEEVSAVAEFLGEPFDRKAAAGAVRPELQRQKATAKRRRNQAI